MSLVQSIACVDIRISMANKVPSDQLILLGAHSQLAQLALDKLSSVKSPQSLQNLLLSITASPIVDISFTVSGVSISVRQQRPTRFQIYCSDLPLHVTSLFSCQTVVGSLGLDVNVMPPLGNKALILKGT
jgi:hypothetical protein